MAELNHQQKRLLNRIRRIKGQVEAVERYLSNEEEECSAILLTLASCRGAINSLMAEIIEGHIRDHIVDPDRKPSSAQASAARELIDVINAYLK